MGFASAMSPTLNPFISSSRGEKKKKEIKQEAIKQTKETKRKKVELGRTEQTLKIIHWWNDSGRRGSLLGSTPAHSSPTCTFHQLAECQAPLSFKYLQGWRFGCLCRQPVPVLNHSPSENYLSSAKGDGNKIHWIITGTKNQNQLTSTYPSHEAQICM